MHNFLFILAILLATISFGQKPSEKDLPRLYNMTIREYFSDSSIHQDQKRYGNIIIRTDLDSTLLKRKVGQNHFRFFAHQTPRQALCQGDKADSGRYIYNIYRKEEQTDTIEVIIGGDIVQWRDDIYSDFLLQTQALMDVRVAKFIYNKVTKDWTFIKEPERRLLLQK